MLGVGGVPAEWWVLLPLLVGEASSAGQMAMPVNLSVSRDFMNENGFISRLEFLFLLGTDDMGALVTVPPCRTGSEGD
ncbi:hypothetical protein E2C01_025667 [Portunus trituberculatus]|uniref:Secreted protein n=1 Tax=Portunus trituberculatus TaxID=210409 RepID=A0A5B7EGJ3_PORTR|nr:hypothetical protein [Portunus trituberculatus]